MERGPTDLSGVPCTCAYLTYRVQYNTVLVQYLRGAIAEMDARTKPKKKKSQVPSSYRTASVLSELWQPKAQVSKFRGLVL